MFLLCSCIVYSQQGRSIEIIVSDSVNLKPIGYTYTITIGEKKDILNFSFLDNNESGETGEKGETAEPKKVTASDIESILKQNHFNYSLLKNLDYSIGKTDQAKSVKPQDNQQEGPTFIIKLKSKDEVLKLNGIFSATEGITGKISNVDYESSENYKKELFSKLFLKAKNEASMLAEASDGKIGKLISVTEVKEDWSFFKDLIDKFGSMIPFNLTDAENPFVKVYERKMQFKFELF